MATNWGMADGRAFTDYLGPKTRQNVINKSLGTNNDTFRQAIYYQGTDAISMKNNDSPMPWLIKQPNAQAPIPIIASYALNPNTQLFPPGI